MIHLKLVGKFLEFAVSALRTKHAMMVSFGKKKTREPSSGFR